MSNFSVPRRSLILGGAALALAPAAAFATTSPDLGKPAPLFTAVDSNGKTWSLADLKGKVVVLETTNHDCPYVRKHYNSKNMQTQQREAAAKGVVWLTTASNATGEQGAVTPAQANELTKSRDAAPAAVLIDPQSKIARAYGATVTPHMYIIDAKGVLVYKGGIDSIPSSNAADIPKAKQYVRLALDEGKTGGAVARNLDLTPSSLVKWVQQARTDRTQGKTGLTTEERAELAGPIHYAVVDVKTDQMTFKQVLKTCLYG